jgi:hypothetical protein
VALAPAGSVGVPPFRDSAFDHGDVHLATGRVFVAHTAARSVVAGAHTTAFDQQRQQLAVFLPGSCRVALYRESGA